MYIRQQFKTVAGKRRAYWALVESVRTESGPRQKVVSWLGALDEAVEPRWVRVNAKAVRVENNRQFGGPWLALQLIV